VPTTALPAASPSNVAPPNRAASNFDKGPVLRLLFYLNQIVLCVCNEELAKSILTTAPADGRYLPAVSMGAGPPEFTADTFDGIAQALASNACVGGERASE
jgi:hypothetical protein